ncbi:Protein MAIN-LIKE 1 [Glycine soja]
MVRTRGLGRALGRVIDRALGREDHHDSDDVPQRQRLTTSARRQRGAAPVPEDAATISEDIPAPGAEAVDGAEGFAVDDVEEFLGEPYDPSVLTEYGDHVALSIWNGEERPELKLASHGRKVEKFGRSAPEIEGLVAATRLTPLIACSGVISTFVERWHKETSSFHLPVGELTITLDDVASLLHLSIIGTFHSFEPLHVDEAVLMLVELLEVSELRQHNIMGHTYAYRGYGIFIRGDVRPDIGLLQLSGSYAWGAAALVHMYDHLNDACKSGGRQLAGYITLLQCWIYDHFPSVHESVTDPEYDETSPRAYGGLLRRLIRRDSQHQRIGHGELRWGPIVVTHRPERVVRQFGYVQTIPPLPTGASLSFEDIDNSVHQITRTVSSGSLIRSSHPHRQLICPDIHLSHNMTHMWSQISLRSQWH